MAAREPIAGRTMSCAYHGRPTKAARSNGRRLSKPAGGQVTFQTRLDAAPPGAAAAPAPPPTPDSATPAGAAAGRLLRRGHRGALPRKPFRHCRAAAAAAAGIATGASAVARRAGQGLAQQRRVSDAREAGGAPGIERPKQLPGRGLTARRSRSGRAARDSRELRGASCLPRAP